LASYNNDGQLKEAGPRQSNVMNWADNNGEPNDNYRLMNDGGGTHGLDEDRIGFIRKVYGIMCTQLILTASMTLLPYLSEGVRQWIVERPGLVLLSAVFGLAISCGLFCVQSLARSVPSNYILMLAFTVCEAYTVTYICAAVN
jgi:FtsH-binding integral membrane protein